MYLAADVSPRLHGQEALGTRLGSGGYSIHVCSWLRWAAGLVRGLRANYWK